MSLITRVVYFLLHSSVHVLGYTIPRACLNGLRFPRKLLNWLTRKVSPLNEERCIHVIAAPKSLLIQRFGLSEYMTRTTPPHRLDSHGSTGYSDGSALSIPLTLTYDAPLYNRHINTLLGAVQPVTRMPDMFREMIPSYDGNRACLDWVYPSHIPKNAIKGLILLLPGITGNSDASYAQRVSRLLVKRGFAVVILNPRGVRGTPLDRPRMYCALFTEDIRYVIHNVLTQEKLTKRFERNPAQQGELPIMACGFSLGGMIVSHYVSEQGQRKEPSHLVAAFTVTSPLNIFVGDHVMNNDFWSRYLYNYPMAYLLRDMLKPHKEMLIKMPGVDVERVFLGSPTEKPLLETVKSIREFDNSLTGPHFGFPDADAYYRSANVVDRMHHSTTPMLCLATTDDPVCGAPIREEYADIARRHAGGLVLVELPRGGHLGFVTSPLGMARADENPMEKILIHAMESFVATLPLASAAG